ncbi:MAG: HDIG domain-containing protein [Bacteroidetes bacterium]|nr:HDIG domain-containing protein [Bacteroidota bacterium]
MTKPCISRHDALNLLHTYVKNDRMIAHCKASEAVMMALAKKLGRDVEKWATAGLLHDLDVEITDADPKKHGLESVKILEKESIDPEIIDAICMHNEEAAGKQRSTEFQHALACAETITGLIVATTLVYPDKRLASVKPKSVVKRMKEKLFAASVNRETIMECEKIGIPLDDFAALAVEAMREISDELGL